ELLNAFVKESSQNGKSNRMEPKSNIRSAVPLSGPIRSAEKVEPGSNEWNTQSHTRKEQNKSGG
ncbi:hypothetical protein N9D38_11725, partial [Rubripirellula sp.]|nr:hypothetical protein [Rubripirellula sp.]